MESLKNCKTRGNKPLYLYWHVLVLCCRNNDISTWHDDNPNWTR